MSRNYGFYFLLIMVASFIFFSKDVQSDSYYYDCYTYSFSRDNVPDLDQVRSSDEGIAGLPNDGEMYCVPTAAMNWMAYIANHGYPAVMPGPGNWEVSPPQYTSEYNFMTFNLLALGLSMNTDPYDGTLDVSRPQLRHGLIQPFLVNFLLWKYMQMVHGLRASKMLEFTVCSADL